MIRLWKAVLLADLTLALGIGLGYLRWGLEARSLRRELVSAQEAAALRAPGAGPWVVHGIVRAVLAEQGAVLLTHETIPGVMPGMTMGFEVEDPRLLHGLLPGDAVRFTVQFRSGRLVLTAVEKGSR